MKNAPFPPLRKRHSFFCGWWADFCIDTLWCTLEGKAGETVLIILFISPLRVYTRKHASQGKTKLSSSPQSPASMPYLVPSS